MHTVMHRSLRNATTGRYMSAQDRACVIATLAAWTADGTLSETGRLGVTSGAMPLDAVQGALVYTALMPVVVEPGLGRSISWQDPFQLGMGSLPLSLVLDRLPITETATAMDYTRRNYVVALKAAECGAYDDCDRALRIAAARMHDLGLEHWTDCLGCGVDVHGTGYCEDCQLAPYGTTMQRECSDCGTVCTLSTECMVCQYEDMEQREMQDALADSAQDVYCAKCDSTGDPAAHDAEQCSLMQATQNAAPLTTGRLLLEITHTDGTESTLVWRWGLGMQAAVERFSAQDAFATARPCWDRSMLTYCLACRDVVCLCKDFTPLERCFLGERDLSWHALDSMPKSETYNAGALGAIPSLETALDLSIGTIIGYASMLTLVLVLTLVGSGWETGGVLMGAMATTIVLGGHSVPKSRTKFAACRWAWRSCPDTAARVEERFPEASQDALAVAAYEALMLPVCQDCGVQYDAIRQAAGCKHCNSMAVYQPGTSKADARAKSLGITTAAQDAAAGLPPKGWDGIEGGLEREVDANGERVSGTLGDMGDGAPYALGILTEDERKAELAALMEQHKAKQGELAVIAERRRELLLAALEQKPRTVSNAKRQDATTLPADMVQTIPDKRYAAGVRHAASKLVPEGEGNLLVEPRKGFGDWESMLAQTGDPILPFISKDTYCKMNANQQAAVNLVLEELAPKGQRVPEPIELPDTAVPIVHSQYTAQVSHPVMARPERTVDADEIPDVDTFSVEDKGTRTILPRGEGNVVSF